MPCIRVRESISNIRNKCLETLGLKTKPKPNIKIVSQPSRFETPPLSPFISRRLSISNQALLSTFLAIVKTSKLPSSSHPKQVLTNNSISLMREKAIASTAIVEDGDFEYDIGIGLQRPKSRASSHSCGLGDGRAVRMGRRYSLIRVPASVVYWCWDGGKSLRV